MPGARGGRAGESGGGAGFGLRLLAVCLGVFMVGAGANKIGWFADAQPLSAVFQRWAAQAGPEVRWYVETLAMPGAPLFARLVPLGELMTGAALILGFWGRLAAVVALFMVANFHFASGAYFSAAFLTNAAGPPLMGGLAALAISRVRLPWSLRS